MKPGDIGNGKKAVLLLNLDLSVLNHIVSLVQIKPNIVIIILIIEKIELVMVKHTVCTVCAL